MRALHRVVAATLVAPMLVLAVSAWNFVGLRCRMTGMISVATCCPSDDASGIPAQSSLDAPGCCERIVVENVKPPSDGLSVSKGDVPPVDPVAFVVHDSASRHARGFRNKAGAEPPDPSRPPLHLLKRSLLI
jgi:hypothetical protein